MFLLKCCQLAIVVLIFGVVIRTKSGKGSMADAPSLQLSAINDYKIQIGMSTVQTLLAIRVSPSHTDIPKRLEIIVSTQSVNLCLE